MTAPRPRIQPRHMAPPRSGGRASATGERAASPANPRQHRQTPAPVRPVRTGTGPRLSAQPHTAPICRSPGRSMRCPAHPGSKPRALGHQLVSPPLRNFPHRTFRQSTACLRATPPLPSPAKVQLARGATRHRSGSYPSGIATGWAQGPPPTAHFSLPSVPAIHGLPLCRSPPALASEDPGSLVRRAAPRGFVPEDADRPAARPPRSSRPLPRP